MSVSAPQESCAEPSAQRTYVYEVLRELSVNCILTKADRRALADHLLRVDRVGTGAFAMLTRLLSQKLLYATVLDDDRICAAFAAGGSRVTYAIDGLPPQSGRLFHRDEYALGQTGIHVGTLLGATMIGMKAGTDAPFLQADGTLRRVSLLRVDH